MCDIKIATLFLIPALEITRIVFGFERESSKILLRVWRWAFLTSVFLQFTVWKEKWSEKLSTNQNPGKSSLWSLLKNRKTSFKWLLMFIIELLIFWHCLDVKLPIDRQCGFAFFKCWSSKSELRVCYLGKNTILKWYLLLTLLKWKYIGMRLAIASTFHEGEVQNAPVIHSATLHYIFFSSLRGLEREAPL